MSSDDTFTDIELHGYEGSVNISTGHVGSMTTSKAGRVKDATELRRYAEFILALAEESERVLKEYMDQMILGGEG